uniref:Filamin-A-interacting protein 1 n=1 Tax=Sphaerodactylus townsendi TaxID=933632 RepID=A0ACB8GD07_9SAUR
MLKTEKIKPEVLEAHYGSAAPENVLRLLHRDATLAQEKSVAEDVYEKPISELDRLEEKQKETYRRMLEQLLLAEKCHRRTVYELENEKHKHTDYMNKSDDFTNLLEQERESTPSKERFGELLSGLLEYIPLSFSHAGSEMLLGCSSGDVILGLHHLQRKLICK